MTKKKRNRGHYCWCCGRVRPNEKFSGAGHARHLCKECSRLGREELEYRQNLVDLERLVTWEGIIGRKKRKSFLRFLDHPDPRIRKYAADLDAQDRRIRSLLRDEERAFCLDGPEAEDDIPFLESDIGKFPGVDSYDLPEDDTEIPF